MSKIQKHELKFKSMLFVTEINLLPPRCINDVEYEIGDFYSTTNAVNADD